MGYIGGELGKFGGSALGSAVGNYFGGSQGAELGRNIGGHAGGILGGEFIPFKTGGLIKGRRNQAVKILAHGQEYILPAGIHPTKYQKKQVAKRRRKARK